MSPKRQTQTVFEKSFKILNFGPNRMHPEFTVYCYKTKNTAKNQNFCKKKNILSYIKLCKFQVLEKLKNSCKIKQKNPHFLNPNWVKRLSEILT